jgi:NADH-quinone oxidoreductase subunit C
LLAFEDIASRLAARIAPAPLTVRPNPSHPWVSLPAESWPAAAVFLRDDPALSFTLLRCVTGLDYPDKRQMAVAYELMSFEAGHIFCVKVFVPRDKPVAPSVAHVWRAADWHERETYDLLGIDFTNHPDAVSDHAGTHPRRILLPEDWVGHPLRKDYAFPRDYQGIPGSVEVDWAQKPEYPR